MKGLKLLSFTALLCACSPMQWVRPNTTPEQTQQDGAECRIAAYGNFPYKELVVEHAHSATTTEDANQMIPRCGCHLLSAGQRLHISAGKMNGAILSNKHSHSMP
jgi:hypothetical protein